MENINVNAENPKLIYAADDEPNIRNLIKSFLEKEGFRVKLFENGDQLYEAFEKEPCDLVILDVMMPGRDGFAICYAIRQKSAVPIVMLTAKDTDADYVAGITLGGDDYFTKPVSPTTLTMRVKAILRRVDMDRQGKKEEKSYTYKDVTVYPDRKAVACNGQNLPVTMTEFNLLHYLFKNADKAVSREELLNRVWGYDSMVETRATDDTVKRLRRKLLAAGSQVAIVTVWGYGFKLEEAEWSVKDDRV